MIRVVGDSDRVECDYLDYEHHASIDAIWMGTYDGSGIGLEVFIQYLGDM